MFEDLLENPEKFRVGPNCTATSIVFPVEFEGKKYIVKKPRIFAPILIAYYCLRELSQDTGRKLCTGKEGLAIEAEKLQALSKVRGVPRLIAYTPGTLIKEYIEGKDFRAMENPLELRKCITGAIETVFTLHEAGIIIPSGHIKNSRLTPRGVYWLDFDGVFDESDRVKSILRNYSTLVFSTLHTTHSSSLAHFTAREIMKLDLKTEIRSPLEKIFSKASLL